MTMVGRIYKVRPKHVVCYESKVEPSTPLKKVFSPPRCEAHALCVCRKNTPLSVFVKAQPFYCGDVVIIPCLLNGANNLEVRVPINTPACVLKHMCDHVGQFSVHWCKSSNRHLPLFGWCKSSIKVLPLTVPQFHPLR